MLHLAALAPNLEALQLTEIPDDIDFPFPTLKTLKVKCEEDGHQFGALLRRHPNVQKLVIHAMYLNSQEDVAQSRSVIRVHPNLSEWSINYLYCRDVRLSLKNLHYSTSCCLPGRQSDMVAYSQAQRSGLSICSISTNRGESKKRGDG